MDSERRVHPDCRNASNPYHECVEYCFKIIEAKARLEKQGLVEAVSGRGNPNAKAPEQKKEEDNQEPEVDVSKKLVELRLEMKVEAAKKVEAAVKKQEFSSIVELVARFGLDDLAAKQGWSRLSSEDKERFEERWKAMQLKEFKLYSQKSGFIHEVVTKMAEASGPNH